MIKLSILICTIPKRDHFRQRLLKILEPQKTDEVEVLFNYALGMSIGAKRNLLLQAAEGEYIQYLDDDDRVSDNIIELEMEGINKGVDCCSLTGIITEDGKNPLTFQHSLKYNSYKTNPEHMPVRYERYPNHLNCIKAGIAKQFTFPDQNHGEDTDWATQIKNAGVLKTEHWIEQPIYFYEYRSQKPELK